MAPDPGHQEWLANQKARKAAMKNKKKGDPPPSPPPADPPKGSGTGGQDFDPVLW